MNKTDKQNLKKARVLLIFKVVITTIAALLILIGIFFAYAFFASSNNQAKAVASPIEEPLVSSGAVKKCETGDSGRGISNREPWYRVYFATTKNNSDVKALIYEIAAKAGYDLRETQGARNYLGDTTYHAIKDGNELTIALTNSGPLNACKDAAFSNHDRTVISLEMVLPALQ